MKIYDCFSFYNELELLEIRLNELDSVVDFFVLVESTKTFQKKDKPLYFQENKDKFKKFENKIIHIIVDYFPSFWHKFRIPTTWDYDDHQKNQIYKALINCKKDDLIIFSDIDEFPNKDMIVENKHSEGILAFEQKHFYYYLNCLEVNDSGSPVYWYGSMMTKYKNFKSVKHLRMQREIHKCPDTKIIKNGGWHFAYLGGVEKIIQKIESYTHKEHNLEEFKNPDKILEKITNGQGLYNNNMKCIFVSLDNSFPKSVIESKEKYSYLFYQN